MVASVETVRDPEHDSAFIALVARPLIILHRDFRGVANARRAVFVFGHAKDVFITLGWTRLPCSIVVRESLAKESESKNLNAHV